MPSANQEKLETELTTFIQNFSNNVQVILTSRLGAAPAKRIDLPIYAVQPLLWRQVEEEIQKHYVQKGTGICRRLGDERFKTLRAMLTNPFNLVAFLTWLQRWLQMNREFPATVRDLYDTLLEKRIQRTGDHRDPFDRVLTHRILTQAGVKMTEDGRVGMRETDFWNGVMAEMPIPLRRSSQEVVEDIVATGILDLRDDYVSFFHEEIQYYYAGPALLKERGLDELLKHRQYDDAVIHGILSFTGQALWPKLERLAECDPDLAKKLLRYVRLDETAQHRLENLALRWLADSRQPFGLKARWARLLQALYPGEDIHRRFPQDDSGKPIDWQNLLNRPSPFPGMLLKEELDELMDEIDEVLEENAEEFVRSYRFPGPPPWRARREPHLTPLSRIRPDQFTDPSLRDLLTLGMELLKALPDRQPPLGEFERFLAQHERAPGTEPLLSVGVRVAAEYCYRLLRFREHIDYRHHDREYLAYRLRFYPCKEVVALLLDLLNDDDGDVAYIAGESLRIMGTPSALKALLRALEDDNRSVRSRAAEVLSRVPIRVVFRRLYSRLYSETDPMVINTLLGSLSMHDPYGVAAFVHRRLRDRKESRKALLLDAVLEARVMQKTIRPVLTESLKQRDLTMQALEHLCGNPDPELRGVLLPLLRADQEEIVAATLRAIGRVGEPDLATHLLRFLEHPNGEVCGEAACALSSIIERADDEESARQQVLRLGERTLTSRICTLLTLAEPRACVGAIHAARALKLGEAREKLIGILATGQDSLLVSAAGEALQEIGPGDAAPLFEILNQVGNSGEKRDPLFHKRIEESLEVLRAWKCPEAMVPIMGLLEKWPFGPFVESFVASWSMFLAVVDCLSGIGTDEAIEALRQLAVGRARQEKFPWFPQFEATIYELDALAKIGSDKARATLLELFRDLDLPPPWRKGAALALAKSGDSTTIDALLPTLAGPVLRDDAYDVIDAIERRLRIRRLTHLKFFSTGNQTTEGQR